MKQVSDPSHTYILAHALPTLSCGWDASLLNQICFVFVIMIVSCHRGCFASYKLFIVCQWIKRMMWQYAWAWGFFFWCSVWLFYCLPMDSQQCHLNSRASKHQVQQHVQDSHLCWGHSKNVEYNVSTGQPILAQLHNWCWKLQIHPILHIVLMLIDLEKMSFLCKCYALIWYFQCLFLRKNQNDDMEDKIYT